MRFAFALLLLLIAVPLVLLGMCYYFEVTVSTYASYREAENDGAILRGWIPDFVPRSARAIREVHDMDSNDQWLRFTVPKSDARAIVSSMEAVPFDKTRRLSARPPRWSGPWPHEAMGQEHATDLDLGMYRVVSAYDRAHCVAVDWADDPVKIYAWSC